MFAAFLAKPFVKVGLAAAIGLALIIGALVTVKIIYAKGEAAGRAAVTEAVQKKTIETQTNSVTRKDRIDNEVAKTPYKDKLDALD